MQVIQEFCHLTGNLLLMILFQQLFYEPISGHAFNADLSQIVVSNSTPLTHVMEKGADGK